MKATGNFLTYLILVLTIAAIPFGALVGIYLQQAAPMSFAD